MERILAPRYLEQLTPLGLDWRQLQLLRAAFAHLQEIAATWRRRALLKRAR